MRFIYPTTDKEANLFIPENDKYTPVKKEEAMFIYQLILDNNITRTLETGIN